MPLTCGNTVPEVGLEMDFNACKHWEGETSSGFPAQYNPIRSSPAENVFPPGTHQKASDWRTAVIRKRQQLADDNTGCYGLSRLLQANVPSGDSKYQVESLDGVK